MTLEWLLIVAAVAAVAAVAVVQVEKVVGETADHATSARARKTAAIVAADQIMRDAARDASQQPLEAKIWPDWERYYKRRCERLASTFSDAGIKVSAYFNARTGLGDGRVDAAPIVTAGATELFPNPNGTMGIYDLTINEAGAHCLIEDA